VTKKDTIANAPMRYFVRVLNENEYVAYFFEYIHKNKEIGISNVTPKMDHQKTKSRSERLGDDN